MKNTIIYFEFSEGNTEYHNLIDILEELVEQKALDGFFTLTKDVRAMKQPFHRPDLAQLSEDLAIAMGGRA